MQMRVLVLLGVFSFSASLFSAAEPPPITVFVQPIHRDVIFDSLSYPARVVPRINAALLSESEGVVSQILTPLGTAVSAGQKLIQIKNTDPIYDYAPYYVESPVTGVVSLLEVSEGTRITRGTKLGTVTDPSRLQIAIEISAGDLSVLKVGQLGDLRLPGGDKTHSVRVLGISPFVDPATGTANAELALVDKKASVPPGSVGSVSFRVREHSGFVVPENALYYRGKTPFVGVVTEGKVKYAPVTLGNTRRGHVEILTGLSENESIVIRSSGFLTDGDAVKVESADKANKG